ncbi:MAG: methyl-accepting chemotaxis protein [Desulfomonile tiedjei]|nr:methyl-accepting chemotaxis protein [Desulfomonile tiedjei]
MMSFVSRSLLGKLGVSFLLVALISIGVVGYFAFSNARTALVAADSRTLAAAREQCKREVVQYLQQTMTGLHFLSKVPLVKSAFETLVAYEGTVSSAGALSGEQHAAVRNEIKFLAQGFLKDWQALYGAKSGYYDTFIISVNGDVVCTLKEESDLGQNLRGGDLKDSGLGRLWEKVVRTQKPATVDFSYYQPSKEAVFFAGVPIFSREDKLCGVLAVQLGPQQIGEVFKVTQTVGDTAQSYLVGTDMFLRTKPRFEKDSAILTKKVDTAAVRYALQDKVGTEMLEDYRGRPVLSAYTSVDLSRDAALGADLKWLIISEKDAEEVYQPVMALGARMLVIAAVIAVVAAIAAFVLTRTITKPMTALASQVSLVGAGDLTVQVPARGRKDEIGLLARTFQSMLDSLKDQTQQVVEGVNVLTAATQEISTTVAQLGQNTTKTSAAVVETTTTVEQVKQSARLASEKAKTVAQEAMESVQISDFGQKATQDTVHRMRMIKQQMESIGENVVRLSEHSQTIEDIVNTVQDIADQSNLLAVNASIEAARAGEHGKGFAVVAHEIKTLADQSKQATEQVRGILGEIAKWVGAVVMATEQGGKAVDAGVSQSLAAGESIQSLTERVAASSQAASVIDTAAEQQSIGVNQVSAAMANIEQAMRENLEGTKRLGEAAAGLQDLGATLRDLVQRYKMERRET